MKRAVIAIGLGVGLAAAVGACGGEDCRHDPDWFTVYVPPYQSMSLDRARAEDAGHIEEIEWVDHDAANRTVRVVYGTAEEWLAMPCAEACSRARDLDLTTYRVVTSCDRSALYDGTPIVRCFYDQRECTESR